jgi:metal-dependent HD superfamily phosphatase/phosphodiesterase
MVKPHPISTVPKIQIKVPARNNKKLEKVMALVNSDEELKTLWRIMNVNAIDRLGMPDHGLVHFQIVANIGLRILRMLIDAKIQLSVVKNFNLPNDDAEIIVFLGCILHDLGMSIHRKNHEEYSLFLAHHKLQEILSFFPIEEKTILVSEILHSIISHRSEGKPLTIEAGVVRVADALDMTKGRSRIPFEAGKINIYSLSAFAIESLEIQKGDIKPIRIKVKMTNSAGIFQIDELLKDKLHGSGIEKYVEVVAEIKGDTEKKLIKDFILE